MICEYFEKIIDFISQKTGKYFNLSELDNCCEDKKNVCKFLKKKTSVKIEFELENYLLIAAGAALFFIIISSFKKNKNKF